MSSDVAIRIEGLAKAYRIKHQEQQITLAEQALQRLRHPLHRAPVETFWALSGIDLEVGRGEVLGLIGRNGAGKSTLLKVLSRITPPTKGRVDVYGRVGSLLEVGTGFHPELTGRENVYLNGSILGMSRREITAAFDSIVDFAGVSRFLDTPVKRYSTGMYVRLAFAVAAHLSSEILLVDEVLAVGDAAFQKKSLGMMRDAASSGRTVVFISHQMSAIAALCDRAVVLDRGVFRFSGETEAAIEMYLESIASSPAQVDLSDVHRAGGGEWRAADLRPLKEAFRVDEVKTFEFSAHRFTTEDTGFYPSANIANEAGIVVARCDGRLMGAIVPPTGAIDASFRFSLRTPWLRPGRYFVDLFLENFGLYDHWERACTFEVLPVLPYRHTADDGALGGGSVLADFEFEVVPSEGG